MLALLLLVATAEALPGYIGGIEKAPLTNPPHKFNDTTPQLQPQDYDNMEHAGINFFEHELLFVENEQVLVWKPATGEWKLHDLMRSCGPDCPIISEVPVKSGVWEDKKFLKLTFMGCHPTTGRGHILAADPQSGNYSVFLFDNTQDDPMQVQAAHHRRIEATQFQIAYMGKDEIIMYDGRTSEYRTYLVEPRLPMVGDEDPIGPFEPLGKGKFEFREQLVYLGNNHVLDYSPTTGEFEVYLYDRGASQDEKAFSRLMTQGTMERNLQLTYMGENQILAFNPNTGKFKAFNITDSPEFLLDDKSTKEGPFYGFGSVIEGDLCVTAGGCGECIRRDGCGWCATLSSCMRGSINGPCTGNCTSWELSLCPGEPCHLHVGCSKCLDDPFCGWCADTSTCTEGSVFGPLFGSCEFSKVICPVYTAAEQNVVECHAVIE